MNEETNSPTDTEPTPAELVALITPENRHPETETGPLVGNEVV
jgi:hypothetical protein